jgi:hypothetical protein
MICVIITGNIIRKEELRETVHEKTSADNSYNSISRMQPGKKDAF